MRKLFCKNDAADFEDLPAFNEEKVSLTMIVAGICAAVVAVAAIGFAGHMIAHHVGGFYARIEEEDERARREEEKEEQAAHAAAQEEEKRNEEKGRTQ